MRYVSSPMTTVRVHISPPPLGLEQSPEHSRASESSHRVIWPSCSAATDQTATGRSAARGAVSDGRKIFWERIARWQRSRRPRPPSRPLSSWQIVELETLTLRRPHKEVG